MKRYGNFSLSSWQVKRSGRISPDDHASYFSHSPLVHFSIANRLGFAWLASGPKLITALTRVVKYNPVEQQTEAG